MVAVVGCFAYECNVSSSLVLMKAAKRKTSPTPVSEVVNLSRKTRNTAMLSTLGPGIASMAQAAGGSESSVGLTPSVWLAMFRTIQVAPQATFVDAIGF